MKNKKEIIKQQILKEKKIDLAMSDEQINNIISYEIVLENSRPRGEKTKYFVELIE